MKNIEIAGERLDIKEKQILGAFVLDVEAGTNGYKGGDAGHGSRTYFAILPGSGGVIEIERLGENGDGFAVTLAGDWELNQIITALEFILDTLREGAEWTT